MHKFKLLLITIVVVAYANGQTQNTPKTESSVYELPDYIVTGTLWDTPIQNVSESVTLFSETAIKDRQAIHFQDLVNAIPNLTVTGGNNRSRYFQLRGLGENSQFEGETPDLSVRFLIDDFDFTGIGGIASLFDLKQVEVIRGAQSSAYGVNASAGIIKLSTNEANGEEGSKAKLSIGTHNQRSFGYATGGTLGDKTNSKTNYRLSIFQNNTDGFIENENLNRSDTNKSSEFFSLLKLKHNLSNDSSILTSFVYADAKGGYDQWSLNNTYLKTQSDNPGEDNQRSKGISVRMNSKNFDNFSLTSVTSLLHTGSLYSYDTDWGNFGSESYPSGYNGFQSISRNRNSISQEIRVDSNEYNTVNLVFNKWSTGLFFQKLKENTHFNYFDDWSEADVVSNYITQSISGFTQGVIDLDTTSKIILALRTEYVDIDFDSTTNETYFDTLRESNNISTNDTLVGGSVKYENKLNKSYKLFLSYKKGYKAAGVNSTTFSFNPNPESDEDPTPLFFDTEKQNSYEAGLFYQNPKNTYISKFNIFFITRNNAQLRDAEGSGANWRYFTSNQGRAKHYGAEYHSQWNFKRNWSLNTNLSYLKATRDSNNRDLANTPKYKYSMLLKYTLDNGFYSNLSLNGSDDYYEENTEPEENSEALKREPYIVVNASIGYKKDKWNINLWAKNLFDHNYTQRVFYFDNLHPDESSPDTTERVYKASSDPLNYGVTINYDW
ncbi:MAG: TonB-dependent receptor [Coraliomargaritaceae bacterium]